MKRTDQSIIVYNRRDSSLKSVGSYRVEQNDLEIVGNVLRKCASSYMRTSSFHEVFINNLLKSHLPTVIPGFSKKKLMLLQSVELIAQVFHSNWDLMTNQFISDKIWERSNDIVTSMHEILNCVALSENIKISDKALLICLLDFWVLHDVDSTKETFVAAIKGKLNFLLQHINQLIISLPLQDGNGMGSTFLQFNDIFLEGNCTDFHGLLDRSNQQPLRFICITDIVTENSQYHRAYSSVEQLDILDESFQNIISALRMTGISVVLLGCKASSAFITFCTLKNVFVVDGIKAEYLNVIVSQLKHLVIYPNINDVIESIDNKDTVFGSFSSIQRVVNGGLHLGFVLRGLAMNDLKYDTTNSGETFSSNLCGRRTIGQLLLNSRCAGGSSNKNLKMIFETFIHVVLRSANPSGEIVLIVNQQKTLLNFHEIFSSLTNNRTLAPLEHKQKHATHVIIAALLNAIKNSCVKSAETAAEVFDIFAHTFQCSASITSQSFQFYTELTLKEGLGRI